jgi:hypothetical protein
MDFKQVNWFSVYKLHHRKVECFRHGNVFLAGDSAHIHSPAGGQGMNTGLQDAYNLCWKLALVLKKQASLTLLNTYNEERLPFANWLLKFTDRGFNIITSGNIFLRFFRKYILLVLAEKVYSMRFIKTNIFKVISQTRLSYNDKSLAKSFSKQKISFKAGDRFPFFDSDNMYPLLSEPCFHLIHIYPSALKEEENKKLVGHFTFDVKIVEDDSIDKWKKLGVKKELFILVRPDNYISCIADKAEDIYPGDYFGI